MQFGRGPAYDEHVFEDGVRCQAAALAWRMSIMTMDLVSVLGHVFRTTLSSTERDMEQSVARHCIRLGTSDH